MCASLLLSLQLSIVMASKVSVLSTQARWSKRLWMILCFLVDDFVLPEGSHDDTIDADTSELPNAKIFK
jgi:hypothetical protein